MEFVTRDARPDLLAEVAERADERFLRAMEKDAKEALQVTKEIVVKFIETSRVSPGTASVMIVNGSWRKAATASATGLPAGSC